MPDGSPQPQRIISSTLHQIDVDNRKVEHIVLTDTSDLESYLDSILKGIQKKPPKRAYETRRETSVFFTSLKAYISEKDFSKSNTHNILADQLLEEELEADRKYGHLGTAEEGHVKRGSFLQILYREGGTVTYLGLKIEHQFFLDEKDFKRKIGLAESNKVFKACKVSFDTSDHPFDFFVFDTNKSTKYWWYYFLGLKVIRDDAENTRLACNEVIKVVNTIKKDFPADYTNLRNSVVVSFRQDSEMKYDEFLSNTFGSYEPEDSNLKEKLPKIIERLQKLPESKDFDTQFKLVPSAVPFRRSKVDLTKEIALTYSDGIVNLDDKIWAEKSADGRKLVVIDSPEGFKRFTEKNRN